MLWCRRHLDEGAKGGSWQGTPPATPCWPLLAQPAGEEGLRGSEGLDRYRPVATRMGMQPLVGRANGIEQLQAMVPPEQLVVPLEEEQRRAPDFGRVSGDSSPGRTGETDDRSHRQAPPTDPSLVELPQPEQRIEHRDEVAHHVIGHRRPRRPCLAELEEHESRVLAAVGPPVAVHRAVDRGCRHPQTHEGSSEADHIVGGLAPRGTVTQQHQRDRGGRCHWRPQQPGDRPPSTDQVEPSHPDSVGRLVVDPAHTPSVPTIDPGQGAGGADRPTTLGSWSTWPASPPRPANRGLPGRPPPLPTTWTGPCGPRGTCPVTGCPRPSS